MIRFLPDNWVDVIMRPLDMISPEANMYVEIAAPDLRLAAAFVLGVLVIAFRKRISADRGPALALFALTVLAMIPWLLTSGNGRYFTAFLLLVGPLCVGLVRLLPFTRPMKYSILAMVAVGQGLLIWQVSPWGEWTHAYWREAPYFRVDGIPAQPHSYVTLTPISYSLIAPQFPARSRWMNVSAPTPGEREQERARKWLAQANSPRLVVPSLPSQMADDGQPTEAVRHVFNHLLAARGLSVVAGRRCDFLPSQGLVNMAVRYKTAGEGKNLSRYGFWVCPLQYDPASFGGLSNSPARDAADAVFDAVEKLCPRFFPPGEAQTQRNRGSAIRFYSGSDTRVYVTDDGEVLYKFWRSVNPVTIGSQTDVLAGRVQLDCDRIRAPNWRHGGP